MNDALSELGRRARERLRDEKVIWLTTVDAAGRPEPAPVWYLFDGERIIVYSFHRARRLENIGRNPRVSLNLNCDEWGSQVVYGHGLARIAPELPSAPESPAYMTKYGDQIERDTSWEGVKGFAELYSVPVEIGSLAIRAPW